MSAYHAPVLLNESIQALNIKPHGVYVDVTFGGGGHSKAILEKLTTGKLIAFDQDSEAIANAPNDDRIVLVKANFRYFQNFLEFMKIEQVDGILADLGVSSHHFDTAQRGFSFRFNGELDMRMNPEATKSAKTVINEYTEQKLLHIFKNYGEIKQAYKLTKHIVAARSLNQITEIEQLKQIIAPLIPPRTEHKFLAKVFQAIRIEVNDELLVLEDFLIATNQVLKPKGRIVIISYHSLEDRLVKNYFKKGKFHGDIEKDLKGNPIVPLCQINRQVIIPSETEQKINNRARSAKMRIAEKL